MTYKIKTEARARFFFGYGIETLSVLVEPDCVRVWDEVAQQYTVVHSLSKRAQARIRRAALARHESEVYAAWERSCLADLEQDRRDNQEFLASFAR